MMHRLLQQYGYLFRTLFVGVLGFLTYLLLVELPPATHPIPYWDKCQHIVSFAGVTAIGVLAFKEAAKQVMLGISLYGGLMEILQGWLTDSRQPSWLDWLADNTGIVLAGWLCMRCLQWINTRHGRI